MKKGPILQMGTDRIPRHFYDRSFTVRFPNRSECKDGFQPDGKEGLIWYTDCSKTNKDTGAWVYHYGTRQKLSFSLGKHITAFQAEVHAIKACTAECMDYKNRNIDILLVKLQLEHLIITKSIQNWLGTAINPS
jgi:hypothetical protein